MRLPKTFALVLTGLLMTSTAACDSASAPADPTPVDETPVDETPVVETPVVETPVVETPVDETPVEPAPVAYPEGPYGTGYNDITKDLGFFDPWTGATPHLSDYYMSPDVSVLVITSAAGWCTACMYEAWDLVDVYSKYKERGLEVLYTLYEDANADPIFQVGDDDATITNDLDFFSDWQNKLGKQIGLPQRKANYPVLVDRDFVLEEYYNQGATPLTLVVRTSDMRILYRQVGYAEGTIEQLVKTNLR